jgi:SAM-dependent methyltransferase
VRVAEGGTASWDEIADSYGTAHPVFVEFPARLVDRARIGAGERVLDIGCGNGNGLRAIQRSGSPCDVTGVDFSAAMVRAARASVHADVEFAIADGLRLPFPDGTFDVALASSVFQFLRYSVDALREWRRVLRDDGRLLFSVPAAESDDDASRRSWPSSSAGCRASVSGSCSEEERRRRCPISPTPVVRPASVTSRSRRSTSTS